MCPQLIHSLKACQYSYRSSPHEIRLRHSRFLETLLFCNQYARSGTQAVACVERNLLSLFTLQNKITAFPLFGKPSVPQTRRSYSSRGV